MARHLYNDGAFLYKELCVIYYYKSDQGYNKEHAHHCEARIWRS